MMGFLDGAALIFGAALIISGVRAIRRRRADIPESYKGAGAVRLGWLWIGLGVLFILAVIFDVTFLKDFSLLFLAAPN